MRSASPLRVVPRPPDPGNPLARLPLSALADPRLGGRDLKVLAAIMVDLYSRARVSVITNSEIARLIGDAPELPAPPRRERQHKKPKGERRAQHALAKLAKCGYVRIETDPRIAKGRRIHLLFQGDVGPEAGEGGGS